MLSIVTLTAVSPATTTFAATYAMQPKRIELNGQSLSTPSGFVDQNTTYMPLFYIQQLLNDLKLTNKWDGTSWHGTTWNVEANNTDYTKTNEILGSFTNLVDAKAALLQYPGGTVKDANGNLRWTEPSFENVDLRYPAPANVSATSIDTYLSQHQSIMAGLGSVFMQAQSTYQVNANYLVSHALEESGTGSGISTIALNKNNLYGYGAYNANASTDAGTFPSEGYAILFQAWEVRNNYLNPDASHYTTPTLSGMASNYSSDPNCPSLAT